MVVALMERGGEEEAADCWRRLFLDPGNSSRSVVAEGSKGRHGKPQSLRERLVAEDARSGARKRNVINKLFCSR
jgi:hypothetical protein